MKLTIDDFTRIGKRVPVLADLKPSGKYVMCELVAHRRHPPLMKMLLDAGLLHGDCLTVTGKTLAENLHRRGAVSRRPGRSSVRSTSDQEGQPLVVLYGNLAPNGAVAKITGKEGLRFTGKARVFNREEEALEAILDGTVVKGDVIVIRYEGPEGRAGHARDALADRAIMGKGLGKEVALITDGRFLRRQPRLRGRPHHAGGLRRRPARDREERRPDHHRCRERELNWN